MVAVTGAEPYCIDSTEVTRDQYAAWLAGSPTTSGQDSWCSWNTSFVPTRQWPPGTKGGHPVVCVNWCDAYAYCKGIGRRLCGNIDGGANAWGDFNNATKSQWFNACTSGGQNDYPYGDTFDGQACNGDDKGVGSTVSAGSLSTCQSSVSGYAGVYDLSGNAYEWEDTCSGSLGSADACRVRGGSYYPDAAGAMRCDVDSGLSAKRNIADDNVGFRCCAP
jgi:formylglycine-generating enzyme required for sulfatase activity